MNSVVFSRRILARVTPILGIAVIAAIKRWLCVATDREPAVLRDVVEKKVDTPASGQIARTLSFITIILMCIVLDGCMCVEVLHCIGRKKVAVVIDDVLAIICFNGRHPPSVI